MIRPPLNRIMVATPDVNPVTVPFWFGQGQPGDLAPSDITKRGYHVS